MRPPGLSFSVSDFIWEEIKSISESPQRLCGYAPYIMHIIRKASNRKFLKDSKHEPFKVPVPKRMRLPSPGRYDEMEEGEGQQQDQPAAASDHGQTGLTGLRNRPDRFGAGSSSQPRDKPPSPIRKLLNFFTSMCKSQRDVLVEQQRSRRERKQMKDTLKLLHNHHEFEPPRSPPSPETEEPEIPSVDSKVAQLGSEGYFQQYAHHYGFLTLHLLLWDLLLVDKVLYLKPILMVRCGSISSSLASIILSQALKFNFSLRLPSSTWGRYSGVWWCSSGVWRCSSRVWWSVMLSSTSSPSF
jgi:hypothetical protein